ncbi:MAG: GTP 3',8-cyclase MoaA [Phycisphaerales bacterium]|nr:GTP 3',8-cyclase MoaA [Phycisphaerales bacterium]
MATLETQIPLPILDGHQHARPAYARGPRSIDSLRLLRISVTDRCNLRCVYCMPEKGVKFLPRTALLSPGQIETVARTARDLGVTHVKLTGGEPTVRRELLEIVRRLDAIGFEDVSLTTNGLQLNRLAAPLREAGVDRITLSIDSLRADRYRKITGGGRLDLVHQGIESARAAGFSRIKINMVVIRGLNDDEVADFAELAREEAWTIRFIEYMPLGESRVLEDFDGGDEAPGLLENHEVRSRIETRIGPLFPVNRASETGVGPAEVFTSEGLRGRIGFISAMSQPFCEQCNRLRLTATGVLRACLFDGGEIDLGPMLRAGADTASLAGAFQSCVAMKPETHSARGGRQMSQLGG